MQTPETPLEWCFVVRSAGGYGEVRIRANGEVVLTAGSTEWVILDGISFPSETAIQARYTLGDVARLDQMLTLDGSPLASETLLYHYTSLKTARSHILPGKTLRLSPYAQTNDPRESKDWVFTLVSPQGSAPPGEAIRISAELSALIKQQARLACFCADQTGWNPAKAVTLPEGDGWSHARMWAQYGDAHRGVVLVFNRRRLLDAAQAALKDKGPLLFGQVFYAPHEHPGHQDPFIVFYPEWCSGSRAEFAQRRLERYGDWLFFTKHLDWAQEKEARLVLFGTSNQDEYIPIQGALVEICLGADFPDKEVPAFQAFAKQFKCELTRTAWRNGFPLRLPPRP